MRHDAVADAEDAEHAGGAHGIFPGDDLSALLTADTQVLSRRIEFVRARRPSHAPVASACVRILNPEHEGLPGLTVDDGQGELLGGIPHAPGGLPPQRPPNLFASERLLGLLEWSNVRGAGPGLSNLGNTCFMNVILQVKTRWHSSHPVCWRPRLPLTLVLSVPRSVAGSGLPAPRRQPVRQPQPLPRLPRDRLLCVMRAGGAGATDAQLDRSRALSHRHRAEAQAYRPPPPARPAARRARFFPVPRPQIDGRVLRWRKGRGPSRLERQGQRRVAGRLRHQRARQAHGTSQRHRQCRRRSCCRAGGRFTRPLLSFRGRPRVHGPMPELQPH